MITVNDNYSNSEDRFLGASLCIPGVLWLFTSEGNLFANVSSHSGEETDYKGKKVLCTHILLYTPQKNQTKPNTQGP
jgi:hypothetical protein